MAFHRNITTNLIRFCILLGLICILSISQVVTSNDIAKENVTYSESPTEESPILKAILKSNSSTTVQPIKNIFKSKLQQDNHVIYSNGTEKRNNVTNVSMHKLNTQTELKYISPPSLATVSTKSSPSTDPVSSTTVVISSTTRSTSDETPSTAGKTVSENRSPSRQDEKVSALDCDFPLLPNESRLWRGNETHEINLPIMVPEDCPNTNIVDTTTAKGADEDCSPFLYSWEASADIQSGDILIIRIDDAHLIDFARRRGEIFNMVSSGITIVNKTTGDERYHQPPPQPAVYQVTRQGHEHCDITEGVLLDITPLKDGDSKLITLYDKDFTEGVNLLIVVSENWGSQCVRLKVSIKSDNCGDEQNCSGKGICFTNISMESYECQCCPGFVGQLCEEQDVCSPSPCLNNGICVDANQQLRNEAIAYQCLCPYGFTGRHCELQQDPCSSSPCHNSSVCIATNETHFYCKCDTRVTGSKCSMEKIKFTSCADSPCINGICIDQTADEDGIAYKCFCQPGFAGVNCNQHFNPCESMPCENGGSCENEQNGFSCGCKRGFTGTTCQTKVDLCSPNPCPFRHLCIDHGNSYGCECPRGYIGIDCLYPAKTACMNDPCANGGTCWSGVDSFFCSCKPGYTGRFCEDEFILESVVVDGNNDLNNELEREENTIRAQMHLPLGLYHDRMHNLFIAAGTLCSALAIVGIVLTFCHCRANKSYERFLDMVRREELDEESDPSPSHWLSGAPPAPSALQSPDLFFTLDLHDTSPLMKH